MGAAVGRDGAVHGMDASVVMNAIGRTPLRRQTLGTNRRG
jgi:hypothetical protein